MKPGDIAYAASCIPQFTPAIRRIKLRKRNPHSWTYTDFDGEFPDLEHTKHDDNRDDQIFGSYDAAWEFITERLIRRVTGAEATLEQRKYALELWKRHKESPFTSPTGSRRYFSVGQVDTRIR